MKQDNVTFTHKQEMSTYIVYEIHLWPFNVGADFTIGNSLLGAAKLIKNADPESINLLAMVLDLMCVDVSRFQILVGLVKILFNVALI